MIDIRDDPGRPISKLLKQYKNPQKGESDTARQYSKQEQRLYERLRYAEYVSEELNIKHLRSRVKYIIAKQRKLKDLCSLCNWETIITAIAFYVKCHYNTNCRTNHIERYKICKKNRLTLQTYSTIITRLKL